MTEYLCPLCKDSRHIPNPEDPDGLWVRCDCLNQEIVNRNLARAGVSFPKEDLTLDRLDIRFPNSVINKTSLDVASKMYDKLKQGVFPKALLCLQGPPTGPKEVIVQTLLYGAVRGGLSVNQCTMEQLIANHFQGGEVSLSEEFEKCNILCLNFGSEIQFNVSGNFLHSLVRLHWLSPRNYLFLNTSLGWDDLYKKYGESVTNLFVRYKNAAGFDRRVVFTEVEDL
jgi:hypothetical protein